MTECFEKKRYGARENWQSPASIATHSPSVRGEPGEPPPERDTLERAENGAQRQAEKSQSIMILPQVHLRKPCYDFYFL